MGTRSQSLDWERTCFRISDSGTVRSKLTARIPDATHLRTGGLPPVHAFRIGDSQTLAFPGRSPDLWTHFSDGAWKRVSG